MVTWWTKKTRAALRGIALVMALGSAALAQSAPSSDAPEQGTDAEAGCTPSRQPHECPDRCPSYDTCLVPGEEQLYYRVDDQRFDCDGYDCAAASVTLGDYCCARGAFAPDEGDGGGCGVTPSGQPPHVAGAAATCAALALFGAWRRRRAPRSQGAR